MNVFLVYVAMDSPPQDGYSQGLGTISAVLKSKCHSVDYIVLKSACDVKALVEKCRTEKPKVVAFSATTNQFDYLREICPSLRVHYGGILLCGGIHPTLCPECIEEIPALDAIIRGEGEFPMLELAAAIDAGEDPTRIRNIWFRKNGELVKNEVRPLIEDLDELPFADKESINFQTVIDAAGGNLRISLSRGCPFDCTFCSNKALANVYSNKKRYFRVRSPHMAIEEIKRNEHRFTFSTITFDDDLITLNKKWFHEFFERYAENFAFPFVCNFRPGTVHKEEILLLKKAGVKMVYVGVEHGHEEFRRRVLRRNMSNESIVKTFDLLHEHGIPCHANLLVGFPHETEEHFRETVRLSRRLRLSKDNPIGVFYPFPGTELGEVCRENNWMPIERKYKDIARATIHSPEFPKKRIFQCEQAFSILLRYPFLPLETPTTLLATLDSVDRSIRRIVGSPVRLGTAKLVSPEKLN